MRAITEKQYRRLLVFGAGAMLVSGADCGLKTVQARGWLATDNPDLDPHNGLRITADGLRALADGVERYGLPDIGPRRREDPPEKPIVTQLREARDEARSERDDAHREARRLRAAIERIGREVDAMSRNEAQ